MIGYPLTIGLPSASYTPRPPSALLLRLLCHHPCNPLPHPSVPRAADKAAKLEAEKKAAADKAAKLEAEKKAAADEAAKLEAENKAAADKAAKLEAEKKAAADEAAKLEAENKAAADEAAKLEAENKAAADEAAKLEAEKKAAADEAAKLEAEKKAAAGAPPLGRHRPLPNQHTPTHLSPSRTRHLTSPTVTTHYHHRDPGQHINSSKGTSDART